MECDKMESRSWNDGLEGGVSRYIAVAGQLCRACGVEHTERKRGRRFGSRGGSCSSRDTEYGHDAECKAAKEDREECK